MTRGRKAAPPCPRSRPDQHLPQAVPSALSKSCPVRFTSRALGQAGAACGGWLGLRGVRLTSAGAVAPEQPPARCTAARRSGEDVTGTPVHGSVKTEVQAQSGRCRGAGAGLRDRARDVPGGQQQAQRPQAAVEAGGGRRQASRELLQGTHLARPSSCEAAALPGRVGALPKRRRSGCLGCRRLTRPSLTGSQSRLGMSSWLGSRQHSSTSASSGSLAGPSSRPAGGGADVRLSSELRGRAGALP